MLAFQNMAKIYYYICIWAVCLLAACSAGDEATSFPGQADAENRVGVTLQLSALSSQTSQSSRSSLTRAWETDTEALPEEMMKSWFVVVVQSGTIEKIITSNFQSSVTEVEKDQVFVKLNTGATTFYSFANIKPEDIGLNAITSVGQQLPAGFDEKTYQMNGNSKLFHLSMTPEFQNGYPMSNKQTVDVVDNQQVINLEVIRMVAKVQLSISNATDHDIVLKSITLSDVTLNGNRNIKLLPNVDSANKLKGVNLVDGVAKGTITLEADDINGITIGEGATQTACFYMNESLVDKREDGGNRYFILSLTTVDATTSTTSTTSNQRYAMLSWNEIRRNDYLKIPIKLEDYQIRWKVEAFSPIGVLPKVTDDGKNLSLDFGYYGEFHIKPEVIKLSRTGSQTLSVSEWQMGTDATGSDGWTRQEQNPEGADGVNIFDRSPAWIPSAYRLEGEMGNRTGSAIYAMKLKVKEQNGLGTYPIIFRKVRFTMKQIDLTRAGKNTEKIVLNTKTFGYERK